MTHSLISIAKCQHRLIHDVYVLLDDGDRRTLENVQLSMLEFAVLRQLDTSEGRRLTEVGGTLLCVKSTITRVADRLERNGLVVRMPDPDDRRAQRLLLTPHGVEVVERAIALHDQSIERRMNLLTNEEQRQLTSLLAKLRTHLHDDLKQLPAGEMVDDNVNAESWAK